MDADADEDFARAGTFGAGEYHFALFPPLSW
jgi:hypothetical protein